MANLDTPERQAARRTLEREHGVRVLLEDNHLLGIHKPAGLLSQAGPAGEVALPDVLDAYRRAAEGKPGAAYIGLVHRLDRNVSGAMIIAKTSKAAARLSALFRERSRESDAAPALQKIYLAWVQGGPRLDHGTLEDRLVRADRVTRRAQPHDRDAKLARLHYRVEARDARRSRLSIELETGLSHQIRAQLALLGCPILGDTKYGGPPTAGLDRPALHALELRFAHPVGGEAVCVRAEPPGELRGLL